MQSLSTALARLTDDGRWFARDHAQRLLVVRASGEVRAAALALLPKLEYHADNLSPWFVLEDGWTNDDDGWLARAVRLADQWELRWGQSLKQGLELGKVAPPTIPAALMADEKKRANLLDRLMRRRAAPTGPSPERLEVFARTVAQVTRALVAPLRGLVLVLAPTAVESPDLFEAELELLLRARELRSCRLIVVLDDDAPPLPRLTASLGAAAGLCDCRIDPRQLAADLEALLAGFTAEAEGAGGGAGASPPGVTPPRRIDDPPELPREQRDAMLREAGVAPALLDDGPKLRALVLGAAISMQKGRGVEAARLQREAVELCERLGLFEARVTCHIALASYLSGMGQREMAIEELEGASQYAERRGLFAAQSQALLALGMLHFLGKSRPEAAAAYALAGRVSEKAEASMLAIEAYRMAGHLAEELRALPQAVTCYEEALRVAEQTDAELVAASSASEVARLLAALKRKKAEAAEKAALTEQSLEIEQGLIGIGGGLRTSLMLDEMDLDAPLNPPSPPMTETPPAPPLEEVSILDRPLDRELLEELTKATMVLQQSAPLAPGRDQDPLAATIALDATEDLPRRPRNSEQCDTPRGDDREREG